MLFALTPWPRAGDGARDDHAVAQPDHGLGRCADDGDLGEAQEVHVRARVEQAQGPVDVVGVGLELEVEPLREHDLEDVTGPDVLLRRVDRRLVVLRADRPLRRGLPEPRPRCGHHRPGFRAVGGPGAVGRQLDEPRAGGFVGGAHGLGGISLGVGAIGQNGHDHVVDQDDALAPVVERAELADDDERGVGMAQVVLRHVREPLDLAHHVVAEIPHQSPVQRREPVQRRRLEARHQLVHGGQDAAVGALQAQTACGVDVPAPGRQRGQWPAPHEGVAAPPLTTLDGLEEEAVTISHHVGEAGHWRERVGDHLARDGHDRVRLGQRGELGEVGAERQGARRRLGALVASGGHGAGTPGPVPMVR